MKNNRGQIKLRVCSDLHTEFWVTNQCPKKTIRILDRFALPPLDTDKDSYLLIAGDFGSCNNIKQQERILEVLSERFKGIVICGGNHEFYGGDWVADQKTYRDLYSKFDNVYYEYVTDLEGVRIFSSTLWTDFNKENPFSMEVARSGMNDYSQIKNGDRLLNPNDTLLEHKISLVNLEKFLQEKNIGKPSVVMTHHAPSEKSVPVQYKTSKLNPCYYTDLEYLIDRFKPDLWLHGHIHQTQDYMVNNTRIVCNPFGYRMYEKTGYDPCKIITI